MSEELETSVDAGQESVGGSQQEQVQTTSANAEQENVTGSQTEKPIQDATTNARFAEVRRSTERETRDNMIKDMYGAQGITTYDQYQQALATQQENEARQKMIDQGMNPDLIDERVANHPAVRQAQEFMSQQQQQEQFSNEANELFTMFPDIKVDDIQPEVFQLRADKGLSVVDAYLRVNFSNFKQQGEQEAIKKISQNGQSSPGALGNGGVEHKTGYAAMSTTDKKAFREAVLRGENPQI